MRGYSSAISRGLLQSKSKNHRFEVSLPEWLYCAEHNHKRSGDTGSVGQSLEDTIDRLCHYRRQNSYLKELRLPRER